MSRPNRRLRRTLQLLLLIPFLALAAEGLPVATLPEVLKLALDNFSHGEVGRAKLNQERAQGTVLQAQGAFDWSAGATTGQQRIYQSRSNSLGLLTTDVDSFNVPFAKVYGELMLDNGIRVTPGYVMSQSTGDFRSELARLNNHPELRIDIPLDRNFGKPIEGLRLQTARADSAVAQTDALHIQQVYLHRVMVAVWTLVAAQQRQTVERELDELTDNVAKRMARLAAAGEVPVMVANESATRAALIRTGTERSALDYLAARIGLATLLRRDEKNLPAVAADFPIPVVCAAQDSLRADTQMNEAVSRRQDLRSLTGQVESANLRARIAERGVESKLSVTVAQDRMLLNWQSPLGDNRSNGARQQSAAEILAAEDAVADLRQRALQEIRLAYERCTSSARAIERTAAMKAELRERFGLVRSLVDAGRQSPLTLNAVADQYAAVRRQEIDAQLFYAVALADLRKATATIPENPVDTVELARLFVTQP